MKRVFITFIASALIISCNSKNDKRIVSEQIIVPSDDTSSLYKEEFEKIQNQKKAVVENGQKVIDSLKNKFLIKKDEFSNVTWYTHKTFGKYWPNRCTVVAKVNSEGFMYMESNYWNSSDWLFHEKIIVLCNGEKIESPEIKTYSSSHKSDNEAYNLWEVNSYNETGDNDILDFIANNYKNEIKVRFEGRKLIKDITLSAKDKQAIKETVLMTKAINATKS